jgi:uncharacterized DUF497 family protein
MRFNFDPAKSEAVLRKHGISLEAVGEIFDQAYVLDRKRDDPEQYRAIGWCRGNLYSVIFELRRDEDGEYAHLITAWRSTKVEEKVYAEQV